MIFLPNKSNDISIENYQQLLDDYFIELSECTFTSHFHICHTFSLDESIQSFIRNAIKQHFPEKDYFGMYSITQNNLSISFHQIQSRSSFLLNIN